MSRVRTFVHDSSLSLFFGGMFLLALVGQAFAGMHEYNAGQRAQGLGEISLGVYVTSADFAVDVTENWQSEYLQFLLFMLATVWFVQKGSPESKQLDHIGRENDKQQKLGEYVEEESPRWAKAGGLRTQIFSSSLPLMMGVIFLVSWLTQSIAGWAAYNETRLEQMQDPLRWADYLLAADFWSRSLQNWQSELLAVGSMAVLSIYLRQRGSSESKPVGEPHESTGVSS
ncbi:MAG TPA: DUF6766 family protein [Nocardioidaceae bacterium]|nr:DUF6766 family protein [Nocardioidaceae bacterium]